MPELPEVETVRRGLEPVLCGVKIRRVEARRPDLRFPLPERFQSRVAGRTIERLERRAKYLVAVLSGGDALVMHLGMTGRFTVLAGNHAAFLGEYVYASGADPKHDHVVFELESGARVVYNDPRRFGFMVMMRDDERASHALFKNMGVEPLGPDLTAEYLAQRAVGRKVNLKSFLMDQRNVAGLGNIYVSEALHRAKISPDRAARFLSDGRGRPTDRAYALVPAITSVLEQAIAAGGSTLKDYRHADGERGAFQESFAVYDRDGAPCPRPGCAGVIRRTVHTGRATYACSRCQR
ncbi:MAG TPA: bifunctional DNA-formamidopyrimidine glycosylase/DNA-(apurinic or apyrimidinic site) lyase [Hyphomicrobium sp.]|nr:bifunctional DNA-formamidopyrimidine glycosylase/DNA-(apurinic or apyrimidinic site) lyase [Hyphomicrobium sp.]